MTKEDKQNQPKDADWKSEWAGVQHFVDAEGPLPPGQSVAANCGEIFIASGGDVSVTEDRNLCPLCIAISDEIQRNQNQP